MHILHIQAGMSPEHGGPTRSLENYCQSQVKAGHRVSVWTLEGYPNVSPAKILDAPIEMHVARVGPPARLGYSAEMCRQLRAAETPDVYHLHGLWSLIMKCGASEAIRRKRPYLLEPMGMYEPWSLQQRWFHKRIARWWYQDELLHNADCLHVNSQLEAEHIRKLGFTRPIAVIPAGVDMVALEEQREKLAEEAPWQALAGRRFILYLSRLHPKKRLDLLIRSWAGILRGFPEWRLAIAGTGDEAYIDECHQIAAQLGIAEQCFWAGHVTEAQKSWLYAHAHCYVLPTFSENFGNTVVEALAHKTPVITTKATPWTDLQKHHCGWLIESTEPELSKALDEAMHMSAETRQTMGENGLALVRERYSLERVNQAILSVYEWTLGRGPKPDCLDP